MQLEQFHVEFKEITPKQHELCRRWLYLGVLSLGLAGLFALLLVLSRLPGSEAFFPWIDFFHTALVVHVDQSVLIWFLAMAGLVGSLLIPPAREPSAWHWLAFGMALLGTAGIALSAFVGEGAPLMNNYVPVLQRPFFFYMLALFGMGVALQAVLALGSRTALIHMPTGSVHLPTLAGLTLSIAVLVALFSIITAYWQIPVGVEGESYYEYLFWGGGHTLQFAYSQLIMLVWLLLARYSGVRLPGTWRWYATLFVLGAVPVLLTPLIYLAYDTVTIESRTAFTRLMQYGGGVGVIPVGGLVLWGLLQSPAGDPPQRPLRRTLWMSLLLFFAGGLIGIFISGLNTIIPAHYHGSIVGVTLALMGLAYLLLPHLGYAPLTGRMVQWQPWIYGFGQLLHIGGLALSGALGIQRKTAGTAQGLDTLSAKISMSVAGIGGALAVLGGILFVWIMLRAFLSRATSEPRGAAEKRL